MGYHLYDQVTEGDPLTILMYPGTWGIPWLRFRPGR